MYNFGKKKNQKLMAAIVIIVVSYNAYYNRACRFHVKYTKIPEGSQSYSWLCTLKISRTIG